MWPTYLEAYKNLGNLLKERAEWRPAAVAAYRAAVALRPAGRELFLNLGETLQWLGRDEAANATFALAVQRAVWSHPQQRPSHLVRGLRARPWWPADTYSFVATLLRSIDVLQVLLPLLLGAHPSL